MYCTRRPSTLRAGLSQSFRQRDAEPGRLRRNERGIDDVDVGAVLPDLRRLLTVPSPRQQVRASFDVVRHHDLVHDAPRPVLYMR